MEKKIPTYIAIVGSRKFTDCSKVEEEFFKLLKEYNIPEDRIHIITGGARGVDSCAIQIAKKNGFPITIYYPNYQRYGRKAPLVRNELIAEYSDIILAFPLKDSRGTWHTVHKGYSLGKIVKIVRFDVVREDMSGPNV